jgi:hypothetical protein
MHYRILRFLLALFVLAAAPALAKDATIRGRIILKSGVPAAGAEMIVKDSWAGFFMMREREIFRTRANEVGEFSLPPIKYRHTIDILIPSKPCGWFTGNATILDSDRSHDGIYDVTIELLDKPCNREVQPNSSFKPTPLRGAA